MEIDVCFSPILFDTYTKKEEVVVITDIFRATTTMCRAFHNGAKSIISVSSQQEAEQYKRKGFLVGAERNVKRCDFADFGNSPFEYTSDKVENKEIVFTTTNGTRAIEVAKESDVVLIGAFSNLEAVIEECVELRKRVVILCAGWNNKVNLEDLLFAGAFAEEYIKTTGAIRASDSVRIVLDMWKNAKNNLMHYLKDSDHLKRLLDNNLEEDAKYCLVQNSVSLVPYLDKDNKIKVTRE